MASTAITAQNTKIFINTGTVASPTFTLIPNVVSFNGPGGTAQVIDVTNLASVAKEKRAGLADEGQLSLTLHYNPDDTVHQAIRTARSNRTQKQFRIEFTDDSPTTKWTFFGYVLGFSVSGSVDSAIESQVTIEIDGPITETMV